jgi:hypothetical protein
VAAVPIVSQNQIKKKIKITLLMKKRNNVKASFHMTFKIMACDYDSIKYFVSGKV